HEENPDDIRTTHYLAREYYFYNRFDDAKRHFREHIIASGETGWHDEKGKSMIYLARILRAEGDPGGAEYWGLRAVSEMAGREPHLFLAQLYCDTGRYHEAKYYADLALTIPRNEVYLRDPDCYGALPHLLAQVADWNLGLKDEAKKHAEECVRLEPENQTYRRNLAYYSGETEDPPAAAPEPRIDVKKSPSVGLAVAANNLDRETVEQFLRVREILAPGDEVFIADKATLGPYNPARNKNTAIAAAIRAGKQIVIQTDIDMAISPELLEKTRRTVRDGVYFFSRCVDHLGALNRDGYGAWNALTASDWLKTGGLDERMFGYGYEDTAFFFDREKDGFEVVRNTESYPVHQPHLAPRAWNGVDYGQQCRNRALMSVPRTRNYLQGRLAGFSDDVKKHIRFAQFFTNSTCPRACRQCNQQRYLRQTRGWEATLDDVEFFCRCAELQGYTFERVILAGGDPYIWKNLEEGVRMFHDSPAFGGVNLFTGIIDEKLTRRIEPLMQYIGLSYYGVEPEFTSPKMEVDRTSASHWILPSEPVPGTLPADCCCFGPNVRAGRVYRCSTIPDLLLAEGEELAAEDYSEPLTSQFLDLYLGADIYQDYHCASCVANLNLRPHLQKEPNTDQKVLVVTD
ncbi:MAG: 4Fe-4S cluster-binding domain-containing protein, partial [Thermoguttaceae bacterium]|nr:4Fe-4S cluster-binding domain-containing protein [Thermoguttaceae bacterium]